MICGVVLRGLNRAMHCTCRDELTFRKFRPLLYESRWFSDAEAIKTRKRPLPNSASVVVVGGGIIGTSVAYHLAKLGMENVVLLERDRLTSGTTWHAAGLINTFGSLSSTSTYMRQYTKELYSKILPEETGMETGFMPIGFIELACDHLV